MRTLNVDVRLILDIDVLDNEKTIEDIASVFGVNWSTLKKDYNDFASNLHSPKEYINRGDARNLILGILDASQDDKLASKEIKSITEGIKTISKWKHLKHEGVSVYLLAMQGDRLITSIKFSVNITSTLFL